MKLDLNYCFNCGAIIKKNVCGECGYEFSLNDKCPRMLNKGTVCAMSRRVCKEKNWEECKVLRNDK